MCPALQSSRIMEPHAVAGHLSLMSSEPDSVIWARVQANDRHALACLFDRHAKAVYNHCFYRTANWVIAEA